MFDALLTHIASSSPAFLASQLLAGCALVSDAVSFQIKDRRGVLLFLAISSVLLSVHYALLGHIAGTLIVGISALRFFVARYTRHIAVFGLFFIATLLAVGATMTFWGDAFILITGVCGTIAAFQKNDVRLRLTMLIATTSVIAYNILIGSPVGMLVELLFLTSNLIGLYRHYARKHTEA